MLLAQHSDAANATSTTSGDANPVYDTTVTSPPTTAPAGATLLAPNAITRAEPTTPWASPRGSGLLAPMPWPFWCAVRARPDGMLAICPRPRSRPGRGSLPGHLWDPGNRGPYARWKTLEVRSRQRLSGELTDIVWRCAWQCAYRRSVRWARGAVGLERTARKYSNRPGFRGDSWGRPETVTCTDTLLWTCCHCMACKRSGVRIPIAPPSSNL